MKQASQAIDVCILINWHIFLGHTILHATRKLVLTILTASYYNDNGKRQMLQHNYCKLYVHFI